MKTPTIDDFHKYTGLHCHRLWKEVGEGFVCPGCRRTKFQILRWTTRFPGKPNAFKDWVAVLHRHHDHSKERFPVNQGRFPETVICDQCNAADGVVKRKLKLPENFSFSPAEIVLFITATPHGKHRIDFGKGGEIYLKLNT